MDRWMGVRMVHVFWCSKGWIYRRCFSWWVFDFSLPNNWAKSPFFSIHLMLELVLPSCHLLNFSSFQQLELLENQTIAGLKALSLSLYMWSPHVSTSLRCPCESSMCFQQCFIQHLPPFSCLYLVLFCFVSIVSVWGTCAVTSMMLSCFNSCYSRHPLSSQLLLSDWAEQRKNSSLTF